jgi:hypothetical protein
VEWGRGVVDVGFQSRFREGGDGSLGIFELVRVEEDA